MGPYATSRTPRFSLRHQRSSQVNVSQPATRWLPKEHPYLNQRSVLRPHLHSLKPQRLPAYTAEQKRLVRSSTTRASRHPNYTSAERLDHACRSLMKAYPQRPIRTLCPLDNSKFQSPSLARDEQEAELPHFEAYSRRIARRVVLASLWERLF
jgi:hypothetical protein